MHFLAKPVLKDPLVELLTSFTHDGPSEVAEPEKEESELTLMFLRHEKKWHLRQKAGSDEICIGIS